ncbi:MAG: hypothetical protein WC551_00425 [Patescibacteria group bacterium]
MEKFHLPILQANPFEPKVESKEKELPVEFKIAKAFLYQKYPLSEKGEELRNKVVDVVEALKHNPSDKESLEKLQELKSELPTVEEPHLEMFAELEVSSEDEERFFGADLKVVQVTKGCRHQCDHCAADAAKKVQVMPFAAVLKIAEKAKLGEQEMVRLEQEVSQAFKDLGGDAKALALARQIDRLTEDSAYRSNSKMKHLLNVLEREWDTSKINSLHDWWDFYRVGPGDKRIIDELNKFFRYIEDLPPLRRVKRVYRIVDNDFSNILYALHEGMRRSLLNYYDSDPFDYRDTTFLHQDGKPADYGDVAAALASAHRPVEFTTAGYPKNDAVAQSAAEKIARMPKENLRSPRISLHPYEKGTSQGDPEKYAADMENVLATLAPIKPQVVYMEKVFSPEHEAFRPVLKQLYESAKDRSSVIHGWPGYGIAVSRYSGRAAQDYGQNEVDHDVMSCMSGIRIWPDGTLHRQADEADIYTGKGLRPQPLGKSLYKLKSKQQ